MEAASGTSVPYERVDESREPTTEDFREPTTEELRRLLAAAASPRKLQQQDTAGLGKGAFIEPWVTYGEEAEAWKRSLVEDWKLWIVPSSLLMTVAFGLISDIDDDMLAPRHGYPYEETFRWAIAHVYFFSMAASGLIALKAINEYMQKILLVEHTPSAILPQVLALERHFEHKEESKTLPLARRIVQWLRVKDKASAYRQSIGCLGTGICCGVFLRSGPSYAFMIALPFVVLTQDMRHEGYLAFTGPWARLNAVLEEIRRTANEPTNRAPPPKSPVT